MITDEKTGLVRKDSIEELCGHRARAIELYRQAAGLLADAKAAHMLACGGNPYISTDFLKHGYRSLPTGDAMDQAVKPCIDRDMWHHIMKATKLGSLMDAEAREQFERDLEKSPPECTVDNILATVQGLMGQAGQLFRRGLVNAFRHLSIDHKTNDGFKVGKKAIWNSGVTFQKGFGFHMNHYREGELADIDRCFHVLDGKAPPDHQQGICAAMRTEMWRRDGVPSTQAETEYMTAKWHQTGSVHLVFKRLDLLEKINKMIADHYGEAVGAGHSARKAS